MGEARWRRRKFVANSEENQWGKVEKKVDGTLASYVNNSINPKHKWRLACLLFASPCFCGLATVQIDPSCNGYSNVSVQVVYLTLLLPVPAFPATPYSVKTANTAIIWFSCTPGLRIICARNVNDTINENAQLLVKLLCATFCAWFS